MNRSKLVGAFIRRQPLSWGFQALTLALGIAVLVALLALDAGLSDRFQRDLAGIDLVVGAKGSPLQIILSSVFELDQPTGNIPLSTIETLKRNQMVKSVVPVSLGDNFAGFRIVGTSPAYGDLYRARFAAGGWWSAPMEAVIGAEAERRLKLKIGDVFVGDHGLSPGGETHKDSPYRVAGVLAPSGAVIDRLILTDTASVWKVHERENAEHEEALAAGGKIDPDDVDTSPDHHQVTALLIGYRSPMGALMLPRAISAMPDLQAAVPAMEAAHLMTLLGNGGDVLQAFGFGLLVLSGLGFFVALYGAVSQRRRELALLRALGAPPRLLFGLIALEGLALGLAGGVAGIALGRLAAATAAFVAAQGGGPAVPLPPLGLVEMAVAGGALLLSLAAAAIPAAIAYRTQPAVILRGA